ncbi:hypothetical protein BN59_03339 [Legionella massiliensis]|uniref:Uncharacterized protein n=1 Tax=Legionella massiliensis TaxID=1034943 RepID=A0A078L535_9GAMM|nr:hypothetical protein BN59_03339 [Legionella massiliensis]CEE14761.1 hypothetical protein BN1094_03339 [Legionella massiliensis]
MNPNSRGLSTQVSVIDEPCPPKARHPERSEGSPGLAQCHIQEILRCAPKDVRHVERRETSPECSTVLIPEIPHYVRDDEVFIDVYPKGAGALWMT